MSFRTRLSRTEAQGRLMHARAFDELSRFTTALSLAPIILVFTRPCAYLFDSKRRIVDTTLNTGKMAQEATEGGGTVKRDNNLLAGEEMEYLGRKNRGRLFWDWQHSSVGPLARVSQFSPAESLWPVGELKAQNNQPINTLNRTSLCISESSAATRFYVQSRPYDHAHDSMDSFPLTDC